MTKKSSIFPAAVVLGAMAGAPIAAWAGSITNADLTGKKICWSDGWATYGKNGSFDSGGCGHGAWRLAGDRVEIRATNCGFSFTITKDNGTLHALGANGYEAWGKYCK
jgi:hypothetical protein